MKYPFPDNTETTTHILKAFNYYKCMLTHCCFDEVTAKYIEDNWWKDYETIENFNNL